MFTIKVHTATGHAVRECKSYIFFRGDEVDGIALQIDSLRCDDGSEDGFLIPVGINTIYIMNSSGKTVDSFQQYPPDHPKRQALEPRLRGADYESRVTAARAKATERYTQKDPKQIAATPAS